MFAMTFFIVLFIVLMQFLWRYMDDLIGKGLAASVLGELFFYAAVSMVPMALPLAILLASLMTFGNLGEKSELTAIKASGVSLLRIMAPLIVLVSGISVLAFFFQNDVLPRAQVKMWTLLFSARQKSPELEIPKGSFYDQIPGYNIYVKDKNPDTGMLFNVMIYDVTHTDNSTILLADTARLAFTKDMRYLYLHLKNGEQFENLRQQNMNSQNIPFRREKFLEKELLIPFDANFNRLDEEGMRQQYVGKNVAELRVAIDSLRHRVDSIGLDSRKDFQRQNFSRLLGGNEISLSYETEKERGEKMEKGEEKVLPLSIDSLMTALSPSQRDMIMTGVRNNLRQSFNSMEFRAIQMDEEKVRVRRNNIELLKKYTLSVACLIFLFIGAPLGAIIRKGGLGMPLVISVALFLVYYIIDNTGYKMARSGLWQEWAGIWLSTFILLPLGVFVTWKAMNDSSVFNPDIYRNWLYRTFGVPQSRMVRKKEVIINDIDPIRARTMLASLAAMSRQWLEFHTRRQSYRKYWTVPIARPEVENIAQLVEDTVTYLSDSRSLLIIDRLNRFPIVNWLWIYHPFANTRLNKILMYSGILGLPLYLLSLPYLHRLHEDMKKVMTTSEELLHISSGDIEIPQQ